MKNYKILFADLDGTLIKTKSGETFPKGIWDMEFRFEVLDAIKKMQLDAVFIVSNQGGIEQGFISKNYFEIKLEYIKLAIKEYVNILTYANYCPSNDKNNFYRKPNIGMLNEGMYKYKVWYNKGQIMLNECLMIGDASGKEGQYSDTDKKTAENFGCDYLDVEDFVKLVNNE